MRSIMLLPLSLAFLMGAAQAAAAPGDMNVAVFLAKAEKLKAQGMRAMFSPDLKVVKREAEGAGEHYRARLASDRAAGRPPHSCPPPKGKAAIGADAMLAHLRGYPAARRSNVTMKTAFADLMKQKYPC